MRLIDREAELSELKALQVLSKRKLFVVAIYGQRRVGKTRLLLEFLKERGVYFFVNKNKTSEDLLLEFREILKSKRILSELETLPSWDKFLDICMTRDLPPIVFDEFQNFGEVAPSVFGILQKSIDVYENNPGLIILSGSLIGMMKKMFQQSKEPLYGRIKQGKKINPLGLSASFEIGKELDLNKEETLKLYLLFGGFPKYYISIEDFDLKGKNAQEIVEALFLSSAAPLEEEATAILSQEFGKRSGTYYSILEAIATGNNSISSIAGYLNVPVTSITRQINELKDQFELVEVQMPYYGKKGKYIIRHPFLQFWFSQFYKNFSDYASRNPEFMRRIKENLNSYYGRAFERAAAEFLVSKLCLIKAQPQWGKVAKAEKGRDTYEIDFIGTGNGKQIFIFEFKWQDLTYAQAQQTLTQLSAKSKILPKLPPNPYFGIVAKSILGKEKLRADQFYAYDLDDM